MNALIHTGADLRLVDTSGIQVMLSDGYERGHGLWVKEIVQEGDGDGGVRVFDGSVEDIGEHGAPFFFVALHSENSNKTAIGLASNCSKDNQERTMEVIRLA